MARPFASLGAPQDDGHRLEERCGPLQFAASLYTGDREARNAIDNGRNFIGRRRYLVPERLRLRVHLEASWGDAHALGCSLRVNSRAA